MEEVDNLASNLTKKRTPFVAFIFSLLVPGLGQFYNGQFKKAIALIILWIVCGLAFYMLGIISTFNGIIIYLTIITLLRIYIIIDSIIVAIHSKNHKVKSYNKWYFYLLFLILVFLINYAVTVDRKTYYRLYSVSSISMENTLLKGDLLVCNMRYTNREIHRSDIIIFEHNESKQPVVYRVVGLPNDKIEIINKEIYINDTIYNHELVKFIDSRIIPRDRGRLYWDYEFKGSKDNFGPITVPDNQYFVLVDNFDVSPDSRYHGCIQKDKIIGKPLYILFSFGKEPINNIKKFMIHQKNDKSKIRKLRFGKRIE